MLSKMGTVVAALLVLASTAIGSPRENNYAGWKKMKQNEQAWYVTGLYDMIIFGVTGETTETVRDGIVECGDDIGLNSDMLAYTITKYYQLHSDKKDLPTSIVFWNTIVRGVCLDYVNVARKKRGLGMWKEN